MFAYCKNNPVNASDPTGYDSTTDADGNGIPDYLEERWRKWTERVKTSFNIDTANHVDGIHYTKTITELNLQPIGSVEISSTTTALNNDPGVFHSIVDAGNDATYSSVGINLWDWLGIDIGVSSNYEAFAQLQITPWIHVSVSLGLSGLGVSAGFVNDNVSYDFSIHAGMFAILLVCAYFGIDPSVAYSYSYG